jgi:hypothetical protein
MLPTLMPIHQSSNYDDEPSNVIFKSQRLGHQNAVKTTCQDDSETPEIKFYDTTMKVEGVQSK